MKTRIIEAHGNGLNYGKFMVGEMTDEEWNTRSTVSPGEPQLMASIGYWHRDWLWVMDLQTGEGVFVQPRGKAKHALDKHKVWVCPLYEPFLDWLIANFPGTVDKLPTEVTLPEAPGAMFGYRRAGASKEVVLAQITELAGRIDTDTDWLYGVVAEARDLDDGPTWQEIGEALGVSAQAAWQRFGPARADRDQTVERPFEEARDQ